MAQLAGGGESSRGVCRTVSVRIIRLMARVAQRAVQRVIAVLVAIRALPRWNQVRTCQREPSRGMIKFAVSPLHRVMTSLAGGRE